MNTKPIDEPSTVSIDMSEVCKYYPDECKFCDYNHSGGCSLYCIESLKRELAAVRKENASLKVEIAQLKKDKLEFNAQCFHKDETISVLKNRITELEFDNRSLVEQMNQIAQIADKGE